MFYRNISTNTHLLNRIKKLNVRKVVRKDEEVDLTKYREMKVYNPGVDRRLEALKDEGITLKQIKNIDNSEADFYNFHNLYDKYEKEKEAHREFIGLKMVGKKYFDEQTPNFLTWSEKELIRELNREDPEIWTPQKIAESFPTSPEGAKKLLKVTWKPASQSRIDRHDASAMRNWKELKEGEMDGVSPELKEHILKFSNRTIPTKDKDPMQNKIEILSKPIEQIGEFTKIVTKYENNDKHVENKQIPASNNNNEDNELITNCANITENVKKSFNKLTTLDELKGTLKLENKLDILKEDSQPINVDTNQTTDIKNDVMLNTNNNNSLSNNVQTPDNNILQAYANRIRIPKKLLKIGATYKVNDCYYDWDGRFLYRVPGLE